uniref:Uncharacterized protein n=1 Tax=Rhizophora mucronata TaxID=61149 RepID=A0A2P2L2F6_RHIMU
MHIPKQKASLCRPHFIGRIFLKLHQLRNFLDTLISRSWMKGFTCLRLFQLTMGE